MKAAVFYGPQDMRVEERPVPKCPEGGALVKLHGSLICGTDTKIFNNGHPRVIPPQTIGHEACGTVVEIDDPGYGVQAGDRVTFQTSIFCGKCEMCQKGIYNLCEDIHAISWDYAGTFAEYVAIPKAALNLGNLVKAPVNLKDEQVALAEPLACVINGQEFLHIMPGETVLVIGAGPIGIMAAAICKKNGARKVIITDLNEYRLDLARKMGLFAVNTGRDDLGEVMRQSHMREGFDVALEMSGSEAAVHQIVSHMRNGGKIALLGIFKDEARVDVNEIIFKGLTVQGVYGRKMYETWYKMAAMIEGGLDLTPVITHRFHYTEFEKGFAAMNSGKSGKVILDWRNEP